MARIAFERADLEAFLAVADELHFGAAADRLELSQPALSRRIQSLERLAGGPLFVRTTRTVQLTPAGRVLRVKAFQFLSDADVMFSDVCSVAGGSQGSIGFGFVLSAAITTVPILVRKHRSRFPKVEFRLQEGVEDDQLGKLRRGEVDVCLLRSPGATDGVEAFAVGKRESLCLVVPLGHHLASRRTVSFANLRDERFVLWQRAFSSSILADITKACRDAGFNFQVVQTANMAPTILGLVGAGVGVSLLTQSYAQLTWPGVKFIPVKGQSTQVALTFRSNEQSSLVTNFVDTVRDLAPHL